MFDQLLSVQVGLIFFQTVIMVSVGFVLKRYAWRPLLEILKKEEEAHEKAALDIKKTRATVQMLRATSDGIIANANKRSQRILDRALATKKAFLEEARIEAKKERSTIIAQAEKTMVTKAVALRLQLKREAAVLVVNTTQKLLKQSLKAQYTQRALLDRLIAEADQQFESQ